MAEMTKVSWRHELLRRRELIPPAYRRHAARGIVQTVLALPETRAARTVGLYADFRGEVPTARLAMLLMAAGKELALPVVVPREKNLLFRRVSHWRQLVVGPHGLREPGPGCPTVAPGQLDLVIVPGIGFDRHGHRLGFGAGYYDRFLPRLTPGTPAVGLAFSCQVVSSLPFGPLDRPVDLVVTEHQAIRTGRTDPGRQ